MAAVDQERERQADALYDQYGRLLEKEHWGEYVAIAPDGRTILAPSVSEAVEKAVETFGPGSFLFKVGEKAVGKWCPNLLSHQPCQPLNGSSSCPYR